MTVGAPDRYRWALGPGKVARFGVRSHFDRPCTDHEPLRHVTIGAIEACRCPTRLHTVLGSCVSVCLYEPFTHIGGMNHILVPSPRSEGGSCTRCGVEAMELLINKMMKLGADRRQFVAKAFGGGNVLKTFSVPTIGDLNIRFVRNFLATERIPLIAERLGGDRAVKVTFFTHSSRAVVHSIDGSRLPAIIRSETIYYNTDPSERFPNEEPILF